MRLSKILLTLSIGMMVSASFASTRMPEKNQEATVSMSQEPKTVVNVLFVEQYSEVILMPDTTQPFVFKSTDPVHGFAVLVDNRWCNSPGRFKQIPFVEKLNDKYVLDKKKQLKNLGISTARNNC